MTQFGFASYIITAVFYAILGCLMHELARSNERWLAVTALLIIGAMGGGRRHLPGVANICNFKYFLALEVVRNAIWSAMIWQL